MNSRNAIETRPVDLSALNKSRITQGRPAFLPYKTTHLRLSQAQTRAMPVELRGRIVGEGRDHHSWIVKRDDTKSPQGFHKDFCHPEERMDDLELAKGRIAELEAEVALLTNRVRVSERFVRVDCALARQLSESIAENARLHARITELEARHEQAAT